MKKFLLKLFGNSKTKVNEPPKIKLEDILEEIQKSESEKNIEPGRLIYKFEYDDLNLQLDIDITGTYRLIAFFGPEKRYSFSIRCRKGDYGPLSIGIRESLQFLNGDRRPINLPKTELVKGHFFTNPED